MSAILRTRLPGDAEARDVLWRCVKIPDSLLPPYLRNVRFTNLRSAGKAIWSVTCIPPSGNKRAETFHFFPNDIFILLL
jgi:hypothetical protein